MRSVSLSQDAVAKLERMCKAEHRTASNLIDLLIKARYADTIANAKPVGRAKRATA